MRWTRVGLAGVVAAAGLVATACYPPSQAPVDQPVPFAGRIVATSPTLTEMAVQHTSADLSMILYSVEPFELNVGTPVPYRFWVYDDDTATTTEIPVGRAEYGMATLSDDERRVVFASNDASLQVGPTALNCGRSNGPNRPLTPMVCSELYLFDLVTRETRQLTGLDGSSEYSHSVPTFTEDGTGLDFFATNGRNGQPVWTPLRLDLTTGAVEARVEQPQPTSWDRGAHLVRWDEASGTLTSENRSNGEVTTLWSHADPFFVANVIADGRYIVLSHWDTPQRQSFRLIDTETGTVRVVSTPWISEDAGRYAVVQRNVAPDAIDRLIIAPLVD